MNCLRIFCIGCLTFGLGFFLDSFATVASSAERPNVVFILADDLGIGDVKCFGGDRCRTRTPGFDRLAREGLRMTDAHANASHCVPTRMAILSGRYPWRFQRPRPDGRWGFLRPRFSQDVWTLTGMLREAGYQTGYVGKWHLGLQMPTRDGKLQGVGNVDYSRPLIVGPRDWGVNFSFILPGSLDMYPYVFVRDHRFLGPVTARKGWSAFNRQGPAAADFQDTQVLDRFAGEAEQFISRQAAAARSGRPFFLFLALTAPHTPISPSKRFAGGSSLGIYGDFVQEADNCIVRVLKALDEQRLSDNTLVIATSDHGAASYAGNTRKATPGQIRLLEKKGHFSSGIYRGYKFSIYEGGLRVPFVARWPGVAPAGRDCRGLVALQDLPATLADICKQKRGPSAAPDSISFLPLLRNPDAPSPRQIMILQSVRSFAVRKGRWKLALCPGSGCSGVYGNRPRSTDAYRAALKEFGRNPERRSDLTKAPFVQLFDLEEDPGEARNVASEQPGRVAELVDLLEQQIRRGRSTPGAQLKNDRDDIDYLAGVPKFARPRAGGR